MQQLCYFKFLKVTLFLTSHRLNGSTPLDRTLPCLLLYFNSYLPTFTRLVDKRMQDVRRCSRVTPTNPACKDNTAESINLHPPEILYVANLHVPLFAHRLLSHSTANLATLSLSLPLSISISISLDWKLGLFGFIRYVLEAGRQPLQPFRPPPFLFLAKSDFNRSHSVFSHSNVQLCSISLFPSYFHFLEFETFVERAILFLGKERKDRKNLFVFFIIEYFKLRSRSFIYFIILFLL